MEITFSNTNYSCVYVLEAYNFRHIQDKHAERNILEKVTCAHVVFKIECHPFDLFKKQKTKKKRRVRGRDGVRQNEK